jgi:hypothetical protein
MAQFAGIETTHVKAGHALFGRSSRQLRGRQPCFDERSQRSSAGINIVNRDPLDGLGSWPCPSQAGSWPMADEQDDDREALRLLRAFYEIRDHEARRIIVAMVEAAARGASIKIEEPAELGTATLGASRARERTSH